MDKTVVIIELILYITKQGNERFTGKKKTDVGKSLRFLSQSLLQTPPSYVICYKQVAALCRSQQAAALCPSQLV